MKILFTNLALYGHSGTETQTRDIVLALRRHGHSVTVFAPEIGATAAEIRATGTPVVTSVVHLPEVPDIIHGQHTGPTLAALMRFPDTPAVFVCHDFSSENDDPPVHPRIRKYLYVRHTLRGRLVDERGIAPHQVGFWPNTVDLDRVGNFVSPRERIRRAAVFAHPGGIPSAPILARACAARDIAFEPQLFETVSAQPLKILEGIDLVFASGRMALEALAAGCAVINADRFGLGGLVTSERLPEFIQANFAIGALSRAPTLEAVDAELQKYDPRDARAVGETVRADLNSDRGAELVESVYRDVLGERTWNTVPPGEEHIASARLIETYLQDMRVYDPAFINRRSGNPISLSLNRALSEFDGIFARLSQEIQLLRDSNDELMMTVQRLKTKRSFYQRIRRSIQKRVRIAG